MEVGNLNKVVVFKKNTPGDLGAGGVDSYTTLLTTRGSLRKINGSRSLSYGEVSEGNRYEMVVRFQTALEAGIKVNMRVEIGSRVYIIESFEMIEERRRYYKIMLNEKLNG